MPINFRKYSTSSMPPVSFKRGLGSLRDIETFYSSLTFWWVNFSSALFGIAIVASFWDVDKSNLAFLKEFVLFSTSLEYDCKTCTVYCPLLISINKINSSQHLARKYSRIFVFGHYLFREANSFPLATLWENCSLLETGVRRQISVYILGRMEAIVFIILQIFLAHTVLKTGEYINNSHLAN